MSLKSIKWYEALSSKKGRRESGCFLVEGPRSVEWLKQGFPDSVLEILAVEGSSFLNDFKVDRWVSESQFKKISQHKTPQGIVAVVKIPEATYTNQLPDILGDKILVLENVQDPGNVGSCIRSAAAFGFSGILMTDQCSDPFSPKCVQSSAGSMLHLWYRRNNAVNTMIEQLQHQGYQLIATDLNGLPSLNLAENDSRIILALGNEGDGLSDAIINKADLRWKLPMDSSRVESLNVAACGAIGMYLLSNNMQWSCN